jgi:hypothetical protein
MDLKAGKIIDSIVVADKILARVAALAASARRKLRGASTSSRRKNRSALSCSACTHDIELIKRGWWLLQSSELPDAPEWLRELKLDGYRAVALKSATTATSTPDRLVRPTVDALCH